MKKLMILTILTVLMIVPMASGQDESGEWEFIIAPYVLFAGMDGESGIGRAGSVPVSADFKDILDNLEFAGMIHLEANNGKWGGMMDLVVVNLGSEKEIRPSGIFKAEVEELILETFLSYRLGSKTRFVDVFAGIRYWDIDVDLSLSGDYVDAEIGRGDDWIDPVVGGRLIYYATEKLFLMGRADIGGFSVGSKFSWNLQAGLGYSFADWFSLVAQYRALDVDYEDGEKNDPGYFRFDTTTHGPLLGFVFRI